MERIEADLVVPGNGEPIRDGAVVWDGPTITSPVGEPITCALSERLTSAPTVGRDLRERRSAQRFPVVPW
jgi:hypothetical protein